MSDSLLFAAIGGALGLGWYLLRRRPRPAASSAIAPAPAAPPSIYEQILARLQAAPTEPLKPESITTDDPPPDGDVRFAPGAMDALFGKREGNARWDEVLAALRSLRAVSTSDWKSLEAVTAEIPASGCVDDLLEALEPRDLTPQVRAICWQLARQSRRAEAVKWGLAIGSIGMEEEVAETLLTLAAHAEFTLYAAHALYREGSREPRYRQHLVDLLPRARQWGVVRLIDYIVLDDALIADPEVQRQVLVHGMHNNDGIPMEVAFTIAKAVDLRRLLTRSLDDPRLFTAVVDLMATLLDEPSPLGGLRDLDGWEGIWHAWLALLHKLPPGTRVLWSLHMLANFLDDEANDWERKASEREHVAEMLGAKFTAGALRSGVRDADERWMALRLVEHYEVRELLPDVRATHTQNPDCQTIDVLGRLGATLELETLRQSIPRLVDLAARAKMPFSTTNVHGREHRGGTEYGRIVRWLGRLATPGAVASIRTALGDYDPHVRSSACEAVAELPIGAIDASIVALIKQRLNDEPDYVAEAASKAADAHGIEE